MSPKRFCHSFLQHISPRTLLTMLLGHVSSTGFSNTLLEHKFLKHIFCTSFLNTFPWKQSRLGIIEGISQRPQNGRLLAEDQDRKPRTEPLDPLINGNPSLRYTSGIFFFDFSTSSTPAASRLSLAPPWCWSRPTSPKDSPIQRAHELPGHQWRPVRLPTSWTSRLWASWKPLHLHILMCCRMEWFVVCLSSSLLAKGCGTHAIPWLCER